MCMARGREGCPRESGGQPGVEIIEACVAPHSLPSLPQPAPTVMVKEGNAAQEGNGMCAGSALLPSSQRSGTGQHTHWGCRCAPAPPFSRLPVCVANQLCHDQHHNRSAAANFRSPQPGSLLPPPPLLASTLSSTPPAQTLGLVSHRRCRCDARHGCVPPPLHLHTAI